MIIVDMDNKNKYFVTFPFPYMNGRLHLGHAYTISKAEFMSRFQSMKGKDVLFPFAFHGTGMPIVSCAEKLQDILLNDTILDINTMEDNNQYKILYNMGVDPVEISKFIDPYYWLKYFPEIAKKDLEQFGVCCDFSRSFVTTDINPHFDSFVKWHMYKLKKEDMLVSGKRPIIYSMADQQPCAGHDRSVGEDVQIKSIPIVIIPLYRYKIMVCSSTKPKCIKINPNHKYPMFNWHNELIVGFKQDMIQSFQMQQSPCEFLYTIDGSKLIDDLDLYVEDYLSKSEDVDYIQCDPTEEKHCDLIYYEPESQVISRTGDKCIVAVVKQWYINYSKFRKEINSYIDLFQQQKESYKNANEWLDHWPCTRSKGLGTILPDTDLLVDSLSDSTIYMAYYTISHLINNIPPENIDWDYIFGFSCDLTESESKYIDILKECKSQFEYWYGVDLRVSGKDLICNHLIMTLHNHYAVWKDKYIPKRYHVNGHILRNGEKMSKSLGNFLTLNDAIKIYGVDTLRFTLAQCGTGIDDANFVDSTATDNQNRLNLEKDWIIKHYNLFDGIENTFWEKKFDHEINKIISQTNDHFENMDFQKVIFTAFTSLINSRKNYIKQVSSPNKKLMGKYFKTFVRLLTPIIPNYCDEFYSKFNISKKFPKIRQINSEMDFKISILESCRNSINKKITQMTKKNNKTFNVTVHVYTCFEMDKREMIKTYPNEISNKNLYAMVRYGMGIWDGWISEFSKEETTFEYDCFSNHISDMIKHKNLNNIKIIHNTSVHDKYHPLNPWIHFEFI
jgi:leucyl-tRNA synthetase